MRDAKSCQAIPWGKDFLAGGDTVNGREIDGGFHVDFCPRCGNADIRLFADRSGWCMHCNMPFMQAASQPVAQPDFGMRVDEQDRQPASTDVGGGQSPIPETPAPVARQVLHANQAQVLYGAPVGMSMSDQWMAMDNAQKAEADWAEEERMKAAGILIYIGSAIALAAVALSFLISLGIASPYGGSMLASEIAPCLCGAAVFELFLGALGFGAGYFIKDNPQRYVPLALVVGALLTVLSVILIGGILGAIGGGLILAGGLMGLSS